MSTLKATKDKARFVSNTISQDELDGDWVDHEVITKYKLPEITVDASTTESLLVSPDVITTGDKLKVLDGANMVDRTAGTVSTIPPINYIENGDFTTDTSGWLASGDATIASVGGKLQLTQGVQRYQDAYQGIATVAGVEYTLTIGYYETNAVIRIGTTIRGIDIRPATGLSGDTPTFTFTALGTTTYIGLTTNIPTNSSILNYDDISVTSLTTPLKYQAPITATTNIPTKAFFNKTIDTTLSAEATGKCLTSEREYITIDDSTASDGSNIVSATELIEGNRIVVDGEDALGGSVSGGITAIKTGFTTLGTGMATNGDIYNVISTGTEWTNSNAYSALSGTGNCYFEVVVGVETNAQRIGICTGNTNQASQFDTNGDGTIGYGIDSQTGIVRGNGTTLATYAAYAPNDVMGFRYSYDTGEFEIYKNGVSLGIPVTLTIGTTIYGASSIYQLNDTQTMFTAREDLMYLPSECTTFDVFTPYTQLLPNHTGTTKPTVAYRKGGEDLTFVSSTTSEYVGTNTRSGLITTGDVIQLDGATEVVASEVVESVGNIIDTLDYGTTLQLTDFIDQLDGSFIAPNIDFGAFTSILPKVTASKLNIDSASAADGSDFVSSDILTSNSMVLANGVMALGGAVDNNLYATTFIRDTYSYVSSAGMNTDNLSRFDDDSYLGYATITTSTPNGSQYMIMDIGSIKKIKDLNLRNYNNGGRLRSVKISVSDDNITYSDVLTQDMTNLDAFTLFTINATGRYFKFTTMSSWGTGGGLTEININTYENLYKQLLPNHGLTSVVTLATHGQKYLTKTENDIDYTEHSLVSVADSGATALLTYATRVDNATNIQNKVITDNFDDISQIDIELYNTQYTATIPTQATAPTSAKVLDRSVTPTVASDTFDGTDTFTKTYNTVTKTARDVEYGFVADIDVEVVQVNINQNMEP